MNGPILVEADPVIETSIISMNRYWNGKRWHFTKKWDIRDHLNNKVPRHSENDERTLQPTIHGQMILNS